MRPTKGQIDDLVAEIRERAERDQRVLVTTLTKKMAEDLTDYLLELGHPGALPPLARSTRSNASRSCAALRLGEFDVLVGINLLREGLDLPEVSLVAILDADKEGFLRSETSLIQTIGRAARNVDGQVIMYADQMTDSMRHAISETNRRRKKQLEYNAEHGIDPQTVRKKVTDILDMLRGADGERRSRSSGRGRGAAGAITRSGRRCSTCSDVPPDELGRLIQTLQDEMLDAVTGPPLRGSGPAARRDPRAQARARARSCSLPERTFDRVPVCTEAEHEQPGADRRRRHPVGRSRLNSDQIVIRGAREHNLKNVDLELPRDKLIVFTGLSGSGKSSLAFDTIYAEGQRRYVESLSAYARQFLGQMDKPDVDFIEGLSPAISIDQKSASRNPRSTVGTITEIYDYLRLLYAAHRRAALPELRAGDHPPDAAADRRPGAATARRHPVPGARARGPRPQGRVRGHAQGAGAAGLHAGPGRRRDSSSSATRQPRSPGTRTTRSRSSSTGWCAAPASSAGSPTRSRPRCGSPRASPRSRSSPAKDDDRARRASRKTD